MSLLVVGSVALDDVETAAAARTNILGGSASYFSVGSSLFGPVKLVAVVGEDFPEEHVQTLQSKGVDLEGLGSAARATAARRLDAGVVGAEYGRAFASLSERAPTAP